MTARDPKKRVVRFKGACQSVDAFPSSFDAIATDWYLPMRPPETIWRRWPISLDEDDLARFQTASDRFQGGTQCEIPEIYLSCVHGAKLYGVNYILLSQNDQIIFESALCSDTILETSGVFEAIVRPKPKVLHGNYCLLATPWSPSSYYHWLIDALPRLSVIEAFCELEQVPLIVPQDMKPFQRDSLDLAGVASQRLVGFDGAYWRLERLFYPEVLSMYSSPSPGLVSWLRERFGEHLAGASARRRLYISRRDTKRTVLNEPEIIQYLEAQGFEAICPGELPFRRQIQIFSQASVIIGPHGAGFSNIVFAPRDATIIEFFGDNYINGCFWALANVAGQRYAFLAARTMQLDYYIPLERIKTLLCKLGI